MRRALVTGGAGFIGSHLSRRLMQDGWKVFIADNLSTGCKENIPDGADFIFCDLSNKDFVASIDHIDCDVIFHLAAQSSGEISFDDPVYDLSTNCVSTVLLLDWALKKGINRFIYTSSMSIYGDQALQPVSESARPAPKSFYGIGKLASEAYISVYSKMGINATSLRLFNVYGPGQNMFNMRQGMVSIYMAYLLERKELQVKGSPDRYRDIVYIDDVVEAYMKCVNDPVTFNKVYNIGTGIKTTVKELVDIELEAFGFNIDDYPVKYSGSTPGDTFGIYADIGLFVKDTGWKPTIKLRDGISVMAGWAKKVFSK